MFENAGTFKEKEMIRALDGKRIDELANNLRTMLIHIYGHIEPDEVVHAELVSGFQKPDFKVTLRGETHYVSMKSGGATVVGEERLSTFIPFLEKIYGKCEAIETLQLYQFGDGTIDGTGKTRMSDEEIRFRNADRIKAANKFFNDDIDKAWEVCCRCLAVGPVEGNIPAEYFYAGDVENGYIASIRQIKKWFYAKNHGFLKNPHIGCFIMRPKARFSDRPGFDSPSRYKMVFSWPKLEADIRYISTRYNG